MLIFITQFRNLYNLFPEFGEFRINRSRIPISEINSRAFAVSHREMIKIMKRVPIPRDLSAHGDGSTWTVFDCREINDLTRIYPFGSLNRRWSGAWLITSALHTERAYLDVTSHTTRDIHVSKFEKF